MTAALTICQCGHVARTHSAIEAQECRVCPCDTFTESADPDAATETARAAGERSERLWTALRRAVRDKRLVDAHAAVQQLREAETP